MKSLLVIGLALTGLNAVAAEAPATTPAATAHVHREHKAHDHGAGQIGIAFDGTDGKIDFDIPAESIVGFEYEPTKLADKKKLSDGLQLLRSKINDLIVFDSKAKCEITAQSVEVERSEAKHSDIEAQYSVKCLQSPVGSAITFKLHSQFKRIKKLQVQVVVDTLQKSASISKDGEKIELKP